MKKDHLFYAAASTAIAIAAGASSVTAQTIDNNFQRDRSVSVTERAKDEFTPLGLRWGSFQVQPRVGVGLGATDNVFYDDTDKESDSYISVTPSVDAVSTWSRHMLAFNASVNSVGYSKNSSENATDWDLGANGRFDISSRVNLTGQVAHTENRESRSLPYANLNAVEPVKVTDDAVGVGITVVGNRLRFIGTLGSDDTSYDDVASKEGGIINQHYRDLTTTTYSGRIDYALSPDLSFFVSAVGNDRSYKDKSVGQDSSGNTLSVGTSFDLDKLARGEVQIGSIEQDYKTAAAGKQSGLYYNAKVEYFPTQLMTVTGLLNRYYSESVGFGASSVLTSTASLGVDHELLRNLILSGSLSYTSYEFKGIDRNDSNTTVYLGARYYMNRRVSVKVGYTYASLDSSGANAYRTYKDNSVLASVILSY